MMEARGGIKHKVLCASHHGTHAETMQGQSEKKTQTEIAEPAQKWIEDIGLRAHTKEGCTTIAERTKLANRVASVQAQ